MQLLLKTPKKCENFLRKKTIELFMTKTTFAVEEWSLKVVIL